MFKIVYLCNLNNFNNRQKYELSKSSYKRDTEVRNHCYINIALLHYLITDNAEYRNNPRPFPDKTIRSKQD